LAFVLLNETGGMMDKETTGIVTSLIWLLLVLAILLANSSRLQRFLDSLIRRIERGDELKVAGWLTLGKASGPLKTPSAEGLVTDDHLALIHRSWRVASRDAEFGGQKMYQIHVILFGEQEALDRVEYVVYRLDPSYPDAVQGGGLRRTRFELKELANGYSLIRADVKIKNQEELVYLSRFCDLVDEAPKLKGTIYLP
jgi:hypothetical protein